MALSKSETQVTFSAANSVSVSAGGNQTSDTVTLDATCYEAAILLKADNSTTPAADDQLYVWCMESSGDPDGASTDEFSSVKGAKQLAILDTFLEEPYLTQVPLPSTNKSLKIYVEGATAGTTNAITFSATITEKRA